MNVTSTPTKATDASRMTVSVHHSDASIIFASATSITGDSNMAVIGFRLTKDGRLGGLIPTTSISTLLTGSTT